MKLFFASLAVCIFSLTVFAQDASMSAKTLPKEKEADFVEAIIPATTVKEIIGLQKDAQIANLQLNNLLLQIEKAKADTIKLQEAAKKAEDAVNQALLAAAKSAGIASDKPVEYDIKEGADGTWILKKKDKLAAPASK